MNILSELDLFGNLITSKPKELSKKEQRKIERAKLLKLGQANYFYSTAGKNCFHCDGFVNGINGQATSGGFTVFKNGILLAKRDLRNDKGFTNNEAELMGVWYSLGVAEIGDEIITDSMISLAWVRSGKPKARPDLVEIAKDAHQRVHSKQINLYWEGRDGNLAGNYNEFELKV